MSRFNANRVLNFVIAATLILVVGSFGLTLYALPRIVSGSDSAEAVEESTALATCRADFRVDLDRADANLDSTQLAVELAVAQGLVATVTDDDAGLADAVDRINDLNALAVEQRKRLEATISAYEDAVADSRTDPVGFLAECEP